MEKVEEEPLNKKNEETKTTVKKKSLKEKIQYIRENITLEPTLACYVIPGVLSRLATLNLNLDKVCRVNLKYGDQVCDTLLAREGTEYLKEEQNVQEYVALMDSWKNIVLTAFPSFLILFLGAWSDRTGKRKICIMLPIIGELLVCFSNILNVYFFKELPAQVAVFFEAFLPAITGGWIATYMGTFSYISDISSEESRTFRVGIANLCLTVGGPIGSALSGILLKEIGYYGVFGLSSVLYIISLVYGFYHIKDPVRPITEKKEKNESSGVWGFLKSFFDVKHVKTTLQVTFKKGPNHRRTKTILIMACIAFVYGPGYGEYTVRYLYTRYRFNWDALKYSFYNTFGICVHVLGAVISISIFSRRLQWDDAVLGIISNISKLIGGLATGFSRNTKEMYIAVAIEMFNATSFTALRSIFSKLATSEELGKMIALFNLTEVVTSGVFGPFYSWVYMMTLNIDVSIIYYISTVLTIPPILMFVWFYMQHKRSAIESNKNSTTKKEDIQNEKTERKHKTDPLINSIECVDEKFMQLIN